jgi:hypothetical protein
MKARGIIDGAYFDSEALQTIGDAFDQAWREIADHFDEITREHARIRLAYAVLAVSPPEEPKLEDVKQAALQVMALGYKTLRSSAQDASPGELSEP